MEDTMRSVFSILGTWEQSLLLLPNRIRRKKEAKERKKQKKERRGFNQTIKQSFQY